MPDIHTFVYSTPPNTLGRPDSTLSLDVHLPSHASTLPPDATLPVLLWFHGGGLIQGSRATLPLHLARCADVHSLVLVTPDYRLCPQVTFPDQLERDIVECLRWVETRLPDAVASVAPQLKAKVDHLRPVLSGSSAGGWLCMLAGLDILRHSPNAPAASATPSAPPSSSSSSSSRRLRPRALAPIYPITCMLAPFFAKPNPNPFLGALPDDDAHRTAYAPLEDPTEAVATNSGPEKPRSQFYMWAQQKGTFPSLLFSADQRERGEVARLSVLHQLRHAESRSEEDGATTRTKTTKTPPVFVVHGDADTAVDVSQSREMVELLRARGVDVEYEELPGEEHLFDQSLDVDDAGVARFWRFVTSHMA